jgi:sigma-E factor negative regulatory protein RseC
MARQQGYVMKVHGQMVDVLAKRAKACESCGACKLADAGPTKITAVNKVGAAVGDWVEIELNDADMLRAAALAYGVPLLMFLAGLVLGEPLSRLPGLGISPLVASVAAGSVLLVAGYYFVHLYDKSLGPSRLMSAAVAIIDPVDVCPSGEGCPRRDADGTEA